ncbi:MAG TPA: ATP-binding protein, partial [Candidatus Eisenbacteria bacterium]|nr:ATP-binding protein [Candidatus Eisenbacteria bacterium]
LRTSVSTCLDCAFPIVLWWGPELTILYNDEYRAILGPAKHPAALGMQGSKVWAEIWDVIGPMLAQVLERGEATRSRDLLLHIDRHGYPEEAYFSFSYSPIHAEGGRIGGIFCPVIETTEKVIGERRLRTLRDLAARCKGGEREELVYREAAAILASNPQDVPFAMIYRVDAERSVAVLEATAGVERDVAVAPREVPLGRDHPTPWSLERVARTGGAKLLTDLTRRHDSLPTGAWKIAPHSALSLPVLLPGQDRPRAILVAAVSPMRALDEAYRTFYELVATQIASGIADAQALEEERRRAEALAAIDRAKTAFFSNVSHEVRTPLTLMLGPIEDTLAEAHGPLPEAASETLRVAHRNSLRLLRLVNTLLDFSRIEAGRIEASYEPVDLGTYTAELASVFRSAVERAGLRLMVDCPPSPQPAYVDRDMWEKIVLNLLSNALKFTFEGEIEVTLHDAGSHAELRVRDTGVGIPEADLPRVFERFHRVKQSRSRTHEGTGIGLALVQELVKLHGGEVAVRSEEGRGTTFTVRVPHGASHLPPERIQAARRLEPTGVGARPFIEEALRWLPDAESDSGAETSAALALALPPFVGGAGANLRVLVADDNADMRDYLRRLLAGTYEVEVVADGQAALESVRAAPPDLVLADVMMPRLDGFGLLAAIREDPLTRSVPVLLLSARAGEESRIEGLAAGADAYMVKPFSARELLARVGSLLELAQARAETERVLRRHDRAKDAFLAMLGHELRNPIGALSSAVHVLEHADRSPESDARVRAAMLRQIRHLGRLVDDLLDMSRVTAAKIRLQRAPVDLSVVARSALETLRIAGALDLHTIGAESESVWVDGDETRLEQVVANLVGNAVKFTPAGGMVRVTVRNEDGCAVLEVRDDGSGIAPEALATIFELFEQGAPTLERGQGGLGIGLTLVQRLVELHGGTVRAESEGLGKGSTFTVSLPAIPASSPSSAGEARQDAGSTVEVSAVPVVPLGRRVLVIEDHQDAREMLRAMLELDRHEVHVAADGKEGIDAALRVRPDVVLIDVGLPELDGYEVARALRASPDAQGLYLVALTGYGLPEDRERAREAGFDEHVVKPLQPERLSGIIAAAAARAHV